MFSPHDQDRVLSELGDKFPQALVHATDAAREDLHAMRDWRPGWFPSLFQREVAGIIHSRIWAHLTTDLDGLAEITLRTEEPFREVRIASPIGRTFTIRVKRHSEEDQIRSYRTPQDVEFWGGAVMTLEGLEEITLSAGYRWDSVTGEIGLPVITYREGKENVIWAVEVARGDAGVTPIQYTPIQPPLPRVDLASDLPDEENDAE